LSDMQDICDRSDEVLIDIDDIDDGDWLTVLSEVLREAWRLYARYLLSAKARQYIVRQVIASG